MNNLRATLIFSVFALLPAGGASAEPVTIVAMGDSLVQGYGLAQDLGFVPQLQRWLDKEGLEVVLVNSGVSGDTTAGGRARIAWTLGADIDALIVSLGGNDALRGVEPAAAKQNLNDILATATTMGLPVLLVGIPAPGNFGPQYKQEFEAIYPALAKTYDVPLYANFLKALLERPDRAATLAELYQGDALHPNASGVTLIVNDIGPFVAALARAADQ